MSLLPPPEAPAEATGVGGNRPAAGAGHRLSSSHTVLKAAADAERQDLLARPAPELIVEDRHFKAAGCRRRSRRRSTDSSMHPSPVLLRPLRTSACSRVTQPHIWKALIRALDPCVDNRSRQNWYTSTTTHRGGIAAARPDPQGPAAGSGRGLDPTSQPHVVAAGTPLGAAAACRGARGVAGRRVRIGSRHHQGRPHRNLSPRLSGRPGRPRPLSP